MSPSEPAMRRTIVAHNRLTMRELRLAAARDRQHGLQIMTFEQLAARLVGGLARPVHDDALREAIKAVLPDTELGELDGIKALPGMVNAAADTLRKAWRAGIDLQAQASDHPRLRSMAALEEAVLGVLPAATMRPADLAKVGLERLDHAAALFGPIDIVGITELSPIWRPLLCRIAGQVPVRWIAGPRPVPDWLDGDVIRIVREEPQKPEMRPADLAKVGLERLDHAAALFGPIDIVGITELSPIWRPLLCRIARPTVYAVGAAESVRSHFETPLLQGAPGR